MHSLQGDISIMWFALYRWSYTLKTFFPNLILFPHFLLKYYRIWVADSKSLTYTFVVAIVTKMGPPIG